MVTQFCSGGHISTEELICHTRVKWHANLSYLDKRRANMYIHIYISYINVNFVVSKKGEELKKNVFSESFGLFKWLAFTLVCS